jgi:hypothetical protein
VIQYLFDIIPVTDMGIYVEPFCSEALLQTFKIFLCLPDDLHLSLCGVHARKGVSRNDPQEADTFLPLGSQFLDSRDDIF